MSDCACGRRSLVSLAVVVALALALATQLEYAGLFGAGAWSNPEHPWGQRHGDSESPGAAAAGAQAAAAAAVRGGGATHADHHPPAGDPRGRVAIDATDRSKLWEGDPESCAHVLACQLAPDNCW